MINIQKKLKNFGLAGASNMQVEIPSEARDFLGK